MRETKYCITFHSSGRRWHPVLMSPPLSSNVGQINQMDTKTEERYVSMRLAHGDITNAIDLLNRARKESDNSIKSTIVRYCIIVYAKPFKISRGIFHAKFIPLKEEAVFPGGNTDHKALIVERDERIAHGDIKSFCPKLHYWSRPDIFPSCLSPLVCMTTLTNSSTRCWCYAIPFCST